MNYFISILDENVYFCYVDRIMIEKFDNIFYNNILNQTTWNSISKRLKEGINAIDFLKNKFE